MRLWIGFGEQAAEAAARAVDLDPSREEHYVGRRAGAEIELPFLTVSLIHARFVRTGGTWCVEDLGSANGTWKDGQRLPARRLHPLGPGDCLRFGTIEVRVDPSAAGLSGGGGAGTATLARELIAGLFAATPSAEPATVTVVAGPDAGTQLALAIRDRPYRVGRAPECELALRDPDCSRVHAAFVRRDAGLFVIDLGARNGVWVGAQRISGEAALEDGLLVRVGSTDLRVDDPEARYLARMRREEEEVSGVTACAPDPAASSSEDGAAASPAEAVAPPAAEEAPPGGVDAPAEGAQRDSSPVSAATASPPARDEPSVTPGDLARKEAAPVQRVGATPRGRPGADPVSLVLLGVGVVVLAGVLVVALWLFL